MSRGWLIILVLLDFPIWTNIGCLDSSHRLRPVAWLQFLKVLTDTTCSLEFGQPVICSLQSSCLVTKLGHWDYSTTLGHCDMIHRYGLTQSKPMTMTSTINFRKFPELLKIADVQTHICAKLSRICAKCVLWNAKLKKGIFMILAQFDKILGKLVVCGPVGEKWEDKKKSGRPPTFCHP